MTWVFGQHDLDEETYQLRRRGRLVRIEPKVFDVLLLLVRNRERVVSKHELLDTLGRGAAESDSVLPRCIAAARRALRDDRSRQKLIKTVHGRGYRFVAEVTERVAVPAAQTASVEARGPAPPEESRGFVGREVAMTRLRASLAEARSGNGRVVFLVGEPGIGKTRTAEQLGVEAEQAGVYWLAGRCYEGEGAPAFWPWLQILRALLTRTPADEHEADLGAGAAEIAELLPEAFDGLAEPHSDRNNARFESRGEGGEQARFRLFESIAQFLLRSARRRPLLITVDDLHWSDPDSLKLLEFLAAELRGAAVLLLTSYRDVDVRRDHPLRSLLGSIARNPRCERIPLGGLASEEVSSLISALTGVVPNPDLLDAVASMTEGNPFFVREVATLLAEEGRLEESRPDEQSGKSSDHITLSLPQGVRDVIGRRLDSLSDDCNALLHAAAVIGRDFDTHLLERVAAPSVETLLELLGEAEAAQIVAETPEKPGHYSFTHSLLRQTLYEELRASRRVALHRKVAEALEAMFASRPDAPITELAHHFFEAVASGTSQQAIDWSLRAAERSHSLYAYDESARHYARAVEALEYGADPDPARRCELLVLWGDELRTGGSRDAGRMRLGEAAELARRLGRVDLLARAAIGYRGFGEMGAPPDGETLALLEEARDSIGDAHPALRARLLSQLTGTPPYANSMETRGRLSQEAWKLARDQDDPQVLVAAIGARYWATLGPDRVDERLEVARDATALAKRFADPHLFLMAHEIELGAYLILGNRAGADAAISRYAELADELRQPSYLFLTSIMLASREMNSGAFDAAERHIGTALERGRNSVPFADLLYFGQMYWLSRRKGEVDFAAGPMIDIAEDARHRFGGIEILVDVMDASNHEIVGNREVAREGFDAIAQHGFEDLERDEHWLVCMSQLSDLAYQLGDVTRGEQLHALLLPYKDRIVSHDLLRTVAGSVHAVLGQLSTLIGHHDEAIACYEQALLRETELHSPPSVHASEAGLARALEARNAPGDRKRASALWESAEQGLQRLGARLPRRLSPSDPKP
jgi:DNA-binding winged helix-turn-helix (wHTH) protein/tetratricopeptide (TPR) repeat protein